MRQRLVFAAALLHDPPVVVVDEPMVGLDPKSTRLVKDLLRQRTAAGGTVFMSTHTLSLAEEIADRIGIIDQGWMNFLGTLGPIAARGVGSSDEPGATVPGADRQPSPPRRGSPPFAPGNGIVRWP